MFVLSKLLNYYLLKSLKYKYNIVYTDEMRWGEVRWGMSRLLRAWGWSLSAAGSRSGKEHQVCPSARKGRKGGRSHSEHVGAWCCSWRQGSIQGTMGSSRRGKSPAGQISPLGRGLAVAPATPVTLAGRCWCCRSHGLWPYSSPVLIEKWCRSEKCPFCREGTWSWF